MTKQEIVKNEITYKTSSEEHININGLVRFLCKHLELKPEDLIDIDK